MFLAKRVKALAGGAIISEYYGEHAGGDPFRTTDPNKARAFSTIEGLTETVRRFSPFQGKRIIIEQVEKITDASRETNKV